MPPETLLGKSCDEVAVIAFVDVHLIQLSQIEVKESEIVSAHENSFTFQDKAVLDHVSCPIRGSQVDKFRWIIPLRVLIVTGELVELSTFCRCILSKTQYYEEVANLLCTTHVFRYDVTTPPGTSISSLGGDGLKTFVRRLILKEFKVEGVRVNRCTFFTASYLYILTWIYIRKVVQAGIADKRCDVLAIELGSLFVHFWL